MLNGGDAMLNGDEKIAGAITPAMAETHKK